MPPDRRQLNTHRHVLIDRKCLPSPSSESVSSDLLYSFLLHRSIMSGMIRLRPTQILLTSEEVSKALHKLRSINPEFSSPSATLSWDHNIVARRHRGIGKLGETAQNFVIHEDPPTSDREIDSGEMSDMSDFSFGPILFRRSLSDEKSLLVGAGSSSEISSNDEQNSESTSWHSGTTLTNDSPASFISLTLADNSISSADEQQDLNWGGFPDGFTEHGSNGVEENNLIDVNYLADVELSVPEDSESSVRGSDAEDCAQESYFLPMDGISEDDIIQGFGDMNIYASPAVPSRAKTGRDRSRESPDRGILETPGTSSTTSLPPTPHSVQRFLEEVPPCLDDIAGLSPLHVAVSRARLARYRSRSLQHSVLTGLTGDLQEGGGHHQQSHTPGIFRGSVSNNSPPLIHIKRCVMTVGAGPMWNEPYNMNTDDSDGGIEISEQVSEALSSSEGNEGGTDDLDRAREDTAGKLYG